MLIQHVDTFIMRNPTRFSLGQMLGEHWQNGDDFVVDGYQ